MGCWKQTEANGFWDAIGMFPGFGMNEWKKEEIVPDFDSALRITERVQFNCNLI